MTVGCIIRTTHSHCQSKTLSAWRKQKWFECGSLDNQSTNCNNCFVLSVQAIEKNSSYPPDCLPELHSQLSWNACISSSALSKPQGKVWQDGPALITHLKRRTSSKSPSSLKVFLPSPALMQHRCKTKKNGDRPLLRFVFWGNHKRQRGRLPRGHSLRCPPESLLPLPLPLPKGSDPCCLCNLPM